MRALIVDDSRFSRRYMREMLERERVTCSEAVDAETGLERLRSEPPFDLMLVDWNMPGMSGPEMIVRARQEGMLGMKILMVTTVAEREHILEALDAGADEFLMKPFDAEGLREKLALMGLERVAE